jgi:beta-lactamase regulating signal transducer with metallopeptidase domain
VSAIGEFLVRHGPMLLVGVTALLSAAAVALLLQRSPIHRQRLAEMGMICAIAWAILACVPMPRWAIDRSSTSRVLPIVSGSSIENRNDSQHPTGDLPSDWQSLLTSLIRPASLSTPQRLADRVSSDVSTAQAASSESTPTGVARPTEAARKSWWHLPPSMLAAWAYLIGAAVCAGWLLLGHLLLWRITRRARGPEPWLAELFDDACRRVGVGRARVLVTSAPLRPVSCGLLRPTVLLGGDDCAPDNRPRLRQVLLHEAAHLKQRDAWGNALFNLAMPFLYFHPLYWLIRSKASLAREMVADDIAASSTSRAAYAADLLELARTRAGYRPAPLAAVGIFRSPSHFYRRMHMLMQRNIRLENRCSILWKLTSGVACAGVLAGACATFGVRRAVAQEAPAKDEIKQEKLDRAILDAKKALNEAAAQRDALIQQVKAGLTPPALRKYLNVNNPLDAQIALLKSEAQVARDEFGENSRRYKELQTRLDAIKSQQDEAAKSVTDNLVASLKAELDSKVALAKQNLDDVQTAQQSVRSAAQDDKDNQDDADQAKQQREQRAIERRRQLQEMQSQQQRQMLEAKLRESEAQLAQMRAMLSQMQEQVKVQTDQARAEVDRANAMLKQQMANAQSQQNGADNQRVREKIDALLLDRIKKEGMQRPQWGEINEMIRRSYLDALGREPTVDDWNATKEFVQSHLQKERWEMKANPPDGKNTPAGHEPAGLNAAVGGLRPQLDLVALANSYADATANVMVARQNLEDARSNTEQSNAKARIAGAEHKARLLRSIAEAALDQAKKEMDLARKRAEVGAGEPSAAFDAEGRVRILSLILQSPEGKQPDLQRQ